MEYSMDSLKFNNLIKYGLMVIVPATITSLLLIGNPTFNYSLILTATLLLIIIFCAMSMNNVQKRRSIISPTNLFSTFYVLLYVVMAIDALFLQGRTNDDNFLSSLNTALVIAILGYLCFYIGFMLPMGARLSQVIPKIGFEWKSSKLIFVSIGLMLISTISSLYTVFSSGGLINHLSQLATRRMLYLNRGFLIAFDDLSFLNLYIVFAYWLDTKKGKLLLFFSSLVVLFVLIIHGSRISFFVILITLLSIYIYKGNKVPFRHIILFSILISAWAVLYGAYTREILPYGGLVYGSLKSSEIVNVSSFISYLLQFWDRLSRLNFDSLSRLIFVLPQVPSEINFLYGRSFLGIMTYFIPRVIFPSKPLPIGMLFTQTFYPITYSNGSGVTPSLLVDFYWNFGVLGIIIGMLCFGIFIRTFVKYTENSKYQTGAVVILAIISSQIFGWLKSGSDTPTQATLILIIPWVIILFYFSMNKYKLHL